MKNILIKGILGVLIVTGITARIISVNAQETREIEAAKEQAAAAVHVTEKGIRHEKELQAEIITKVTDIYSEFYEVSNVDPFMFESRTEDGVEIAEFRTDVNATIRYESVLDMPYFKGLLEGAGLAPASMPEKVTERSLQQTLDSQTKIDRRFTPAIAVKLAAEYDNLSQYIGYEQSFPIFMYATYDSQGIALYVDSGVGYTSIDNMKLDSREEQYMNGYNLIRERIRQIITEEIDHA